MNRLKGIIFDCDGVLFESRQANLAYYNRILRHFSRPLVTEADSTQAQLCHTASSPAVLAELLPQAEVAPALQYAASLDYREFIPLMQPEPHLEKMLSRLAANFPLAVATNRGGSIEPILEHFGLRDYFQVVVTSHDVPRPKPAPDMLFLASERLGSEPQSSLFIGDSELDLQAAAEANICFAGYGGKVQGMLNLTNHLDLITHLDC